jgi:hypothetical protein
MKRAKDCRRVSIVSLVEEESGYERWLLTPEMEWFGSSLAMSAAKGPAQTSAFSLGLLTFLHPHC